MQHYVLLTSLVVFSFMSCSAPTIEVKQITNTKEELIQQAYSLDSLYLIHFNNADTEALMSLHWNSPELLSYPPGEQEIKGFDAIKAMYARDFAAGKGAKLEYLSVVNVPLGEGVAGYGRYRWTLPVEGDSTIVMEGRYSDIKEYKDGKLVITFDHSSNPTTYHE